MTLLNSVVFQGRRQHFLRSAVIDGRNILVSGGTGNWKDDLSEYPF